MPTVVIGEALVDLIEERDSGEPVYRPRWGGSPLNVAVGAARQGVEVELVAPLADDHFGAQLASFATSEGISIEHCPRSPGGTTLAVASRRGDHMQFDYYGSWEDMWSIGPIDEALVSSASVVHTGSTALNGDPALASVRKAFGDSTGIKTVDPNPRQMLIADLVAYRTALWDLFAQVDIVKLSDDDARLLAPGLGALEAGRRVHACGAGVVLVTAASEGAYVVRGDGVAHEPAASGKFVDPTGAGDSFMSTVIAHVDRRGLPESMAEWRDVLRRANTAAAVTCSRKGGAEAMPSTTEIDAATENTGRENGQRPNPSASGHGTNQTLRQSHSAH